MTDQTPLDDNSLVVIYAFDRSPQVDAKRPRIYDREWRITVLVVS